MAVILILMTINMKQIYLDTNVCIHYTLYIDTIPYIQMACVPNIMGPIQAERHEAIQLWVYI